VPPPTGTPPPTEAPIPEDLPPVEALAAGEVVSDPPPHVLVFVVDPGDRVVVLGALRPEQVRTLFRELAQRRLAHTGNTSGTLVLIGSLALLGGAALIGLARRPRRRTA
jgi:LPXTG-motif cell wall-anchored protein